MHATGPVDAGMLKGYRDDGSSAEQPSSERAGARRGPFCPSCSFTHPAPLPSLQSADRASRELSGMSWRPVQRPYASANTVGTAALQNTCLQSPLPTLAHGVVLRAQRWQSQINPLPIPLAAAVREPVTTPA